MNAPDPRLHARSGSAVEEILSLTGVLLRAPATWTDSPRLAPMPWGAGRIPAPPPDPPRGLRGPWPQAPVIDPGFYAPVLNVPAEDRLDHARFIVARYLRQLVQEVPAAAARALRGPRLVDVDDRELAALLTATSLGQFVQTADERPPHPDFHPVMARAPGPWATLDFSIVALGELLPGLHAAPVIVLVRRAGEAWAVAAVRVHERVVTPDEGDAWRLARWYALQGAQLRLVTAAHPRLHFPADVINAVTRSALPKRHPLRRLIEPHTRFTLGLHESVIHHRRSAIHNSQRELYNPFPYTTEGMHRMVAAGKGGVEGNTAWPAWRFGDLFTGEHVPYGRFRRAWLDAWVRFAGEALAGVAPGDPDVRAWADHIAAWLPGFPDGRRIAAEGELARAAATYLCTVSTFHTADHHSFAAIALEKMPWRLRRAMPAAGPVEALDPDALVAPEDSFRVTLAHAMFFRPAVITSLRDVTYAFDDPRGRAAARRWELAMDALDAAWAGRGFPASREIASGVHY
ncbi:MAG: hypothetical protein Q8S73_40270 [Deltaproteobacteria bacterium]|nr:hypothetical protein [Myxococcales bacterium]MDP3220402.1 hypothetical protein [Deltaproteobacteria bacterium]